MSSPFTDLSTVDASEVKPPRIASTYNMYTPTGIKGDGILGKRNQLQLDRYRARHNIMQTEYDASQKKKADELDELKKARGVYGYIRRGVHNIKATGRTLKKKIQDYGSYLANRFTRQKELKAYKSSKPLNKANIIKYLTIVDAVPNDLQKHIMSFVRNEHDTIEALGNFDIDEACEKIAEIIQKRVYDGMTIEEVYPILTLLDGIIERFPEVLVLNTSYLRDMLKKILDEFDRYEEEWPMVLLTANFFPKLSEELDKETYRLENTRAYNCLYRFVRENTMREHPTSDYSKRIYHLLGVHVGDNDNIYYKTRDAHYHNMVLTKNSLIVQILCFMLLNKEKRMFILGQIAPPPPRASAASAVRFQTSPPRASAASVAKSSTSSLSKKHSQSQGKTRQTRGKKVESHKVKTTGR